MKLICSKFSVLCRLCNPYFNSHRQFDILIEIYNIFQQAIIFRQIDIDGYSTQLIKLLSEIQSKHLSDIKNQ